MDGPTLHELRELSERSRRAQRWGFACMAGVLFLIPMQLALQQLVSATYAAVGTALAGGLLLCRFAFIAGEERGAFRRVFRRIKDERKATREAAKAASE